MQIESILLTGGLGYIGSITTVQLYKFLQQIESKNKNISYKIIIIDNLSNSRITVKDRINKCISKQIESESSLNEFIEFHEISLNSKNLIDDLFKHKQQQNQPIKYVIHFAALKAVGESVLQPLMYFQNNLVGTINLLEVMAYYQCENFIYSSSATVYKPGSNLNEEVDFKPSNPYGETKIAIEYLIRSHAKVNNGCWITLRYFNPVGASRDGLLGDSPTKFPNNLFPYIEQVAVGNRPYLSIFGNDYDTPDGTGVRDYIHVEDLAQGHIAALNQMIIKNQNKERWYEYINLGSGIGHSVLDIVNAYSKVLGKKLPHIIAERRAGDVPILTADPTKAKQILGWETKLTLDDMCQDSYRFITMNPQGIL